MKITLPLPPNMANGRFHWRVKNNKRKAYFEACDIASIILNRDYVEAVSLPLPIMRARIKAVVYCGGEMDTDNCLARLKWPVDWLVKRHYLKGDKPSQLEWDWPIKQIVDRKEQYRVEITLEAAA